MPLSTPKRSNAHRTTLLFPALLVCCCGIAHAQPLQRLEGEEPVTYYISEGSENSRFRPGDRELAVWALRAWERHAEGALRFVPGSEATARIRLYWMPSSPSLYGETLPLRVAGRRGAAVFVRPDTDALGGEIARRAEEDPLFRDAVVYLTCLHELGHALGLSHTGDFADIMYSFGFGGDIPGYFARYRRELESRRDIAAVSGLSAGDLQRLRMLYVQRTIE